MGAVRRRPPKSFLTWACSCDTIKQKREDERVILRGKEVDAVRLFVAVQLSEQMKNSLVEVMHDMKNQGVVGSYVPKQNLHMTLTFIGETDKRQQIQEIMSEIGFQPFRIALTEAGNFGDTQWIGVKGNQKLKGYVNELQKRLREEGIPFDGKKFTPHITLLRKTKASRPYTVKAPKLDMNVEKISLMKSEFKDGKPVYKEMFSVP